MCINEASAQARAQSSNGRRVKGERVDLEPLVRFSFWRYVQDSYKNAYMSRDTCMYVYVYKRGERPGESLIERWALGEQGGTR